MLQRYYEAFNLPVKFYLRQSCFVWLIALPFVYLQRKKTELKGTGSFPSVFIITMDSFSLIESVQKFLVPLLNTEEFIVEVKVKPTHNIKVYLDADNGLDIDRCIKINRALYKALEEAAYFPEGDFSLEVSSPGIGEPLKQYRQFVKNTGRDVEVTGNDAQVFTGKLLAVTTEAVTIEITTGKGKKLLVTQQEIPFAEIKHTKVLIKF